MCRRRCRRYGFLRFQLDHEHGRDSQGADRRENKESHAVVALRVVDPSGEDRGEYARQEDPGGEQASHGSERLHAEGIGLNGRDERHLRSHSGAV